eukprot:1359697-Amorphochlora_amoeboformis.AAC.1
MGKEPPDAPARLPIEFLFGYGSIINPKSRASTLGKNFCPGVLADVSDEVPDVFTHISAFALTRLPAPRKRKTETPLYFARAFYLGFIRQHNNSMYP